MNQTQLRLLIYVLVLLPVSVILWQFFVVSGVSFAGTNEQLIFIGRILGFTAAYGSLIQLVLMSRLPAIERAFGAESYTRWHRYTGYTVIYAVLAHPIFLTFGYQFDGKPGLVPQFLEFILHYPDVFNAFLASLIFTAVAFSSAMIVRRRLRHETWYAIHIFVYVAILIAFAHQLANGNEFVGHPAFQAFWYVLYTTAFGILIVGRFTVPLLSIGYFNVHVARTVVEADGIISIYLSGRHLDQLRIKPGQFFGVRFFHRLLWLESHPFSVSKVPTKGEVRFTFKVLGDFTGKLRDIPVGTPVSLDGPRGNNTWELARSDHAVLVAGGIGITPLRALAESAPAGKHVKLLYSVRTSDQAVFRDELASLDGVATEVKASDEAGHVTTTQVLAATPEPMETDYFLCGPDSMMVALRSGLIAAGIDARRIHTERFSY